MYKYVDDIRRTNYLETHNEISLDLLNGLLDDYLDMTYPTWKVNDNMEAKPSTIMKNCFPLEYHNEFRPEFIKKNNILVVHEFSTRKTYYLKEK